MSAFEVIVVLDCHTNRQSCDGLTSGGKNGVAHRRRDWRDAGLARTAYGRSAVDDRHRDFGRFAQCEQTVGVKIVLLRAAILNGNLAEKRRGEPEDDAAFHLSPDAVRIKRRTTVDRTSNAMDGRHAFLDRNLDCLRDDAAIALVDGSSAEATGLRLLRPQ